VAVSLNGMFENLGLRSFAKTSGVKGMQVYVPLNVPDVTFEQTKPFARAVAELFEQTEPDLVVSRMTKARRTGKVLIDWSQNDSNKTTVCVYSLRATERADRFHAGRLGGGASGARGARPRPARVRRRRRARARGRARR